MSEPN